MGRKRLSRQESRLQTRERLLEAAAEVFSRQGFHAASVEEVAEEAGFSKGAVYSNFASKEELFLTLLDRHLAAELHDVATQVASRESSQEADGPRQSFTEQLEKKRTWNMLTLEFCLYALRHPSAQQQLAERYRVARKELTTLLEERYHAEGGFPTFPVEYLSWALIALGSGLVLQAYLEPGALPSGLYATIVGRLLEAPRP